MENEFVHREYEKSKRTSNGGLIFYKKQIVNKIENDCANGNIHNKHANEKIIKNLKISFSYLSSFLKKMQSYAIIGNIYVYFTSNVLKIHSIDENHGFNSNVANKIFYIIYFLISSIILFSKIANTITQIYY